MIPRYQACQQSLCENLSILLQDPALYYFYSDPIHSSSHCCGKCNPDTKIFQLFSRTRHCTVSIQTQSTPPHIVVESVILIRESSRIVRMEPFLPLLLILKKSPLLFFLLLSLLSCFELRN